MADRIDRYTANIGIGNLYKVIEHGQEMGVVSRKDAGDPDKGWEYTVPSAPPVPGKMIYDDAIARFEANRPSGLKHGDVTSSHWQGADATAKALCGKDMGIDAFANELAVQVGIDPKAKGQTDKMNALKAITEQLFANKSVKWWAQLKMEQKCGETADDNLTGEIADLDARLGRNFSKDDLMAAAVTLSQMVARGELDVNHVETYLNETVFDYSDQKATLQMTARAMGEMRAKVIGEGWGDAYYALTRKYAELGGNKDKELADKFKAMAEAAKAIRQKRMTLVSELGLRGIPVRPGDSTGTVLNKLKDQLATGACSAALSLARGGVVTAFAVADSLAQKEVEDFNAAASAFLDALVEKSKLTGKMLKDVPDLGDFVKDKFTGKFSRPVGNLFAEDFKKDTAAYLMALSQGAELSARLGREEEIRRSFKKALEVIPRDANGLCRAGTYSVSVSLGAGLSWGLDNGKPELGAEDPKASLSVGATAGFAATVSIGEDGSARVSYGLDLSGDVTAALVAPGVKVSGGGGMGGGWTKVTAYKDIDSMCNDTSRMLLALTTGKEMKNLFHGGGVNSKSRDVAKLIDNYAMRSLMSEMKLMDDADPYLTPMKYNPVTNISDTYSGSLNGNVKLSAGTDGKEEFVGTSKLSGGASLALSGSISSAKNFKSHFDVAREKGVRPKDDAKYGGGLVRNVRGEELPPATQLKNLEARLMALRIELEDFARVAAVDKRTNGISRAGTDRRYAALKGKYGEGEDVSYKGFLAKRGIKLGFCWGLRNLFVRNIRRTLYVGDLAREAAYCEAKIRALNPGSDMPKDAQLSIEAIENGIYKNHLVHLDAWGRFSAERSTLYQEEKEYSASETVTASVDMKMNLPGIEKTQSVKVTTKYTSVELTSKDFYPETEGAGAGPERMVLEPEQKNLDPALKITMGPKHEKLLPLRPWESKESLDISIDVSSVPVAGGMMDSLFRNRLNKDLMAKALSVDAVREIVFRLVNDRIGELAKENASEFVNGIVPSGGVFKAEDSHALTFRLVKEYRPNGKPRKYVYKLKELSLDSKGKKSAGIDLPVLPGVKLSAQVSRSSSENVRYWVGTDSLSGMMAHYGRLGGKPVLWEAFLNEQASTLADLVKNAGTPQCGKGEDLGPKAGKIEPRTGLQGELDRIQQFMWMHGDRAQYDAFMAAWADVRNAASTIDSADKSVQKNGKAMTRLLSTVAAFYREENKWWETKEMPKPEAQQEAKVEEVKQPIVKPRFQAVRNHRKAELPNRNLQGVQADLDKVEHKRFKQLIQNIEAVEKSKAGKVKA